MSYNRETSNVDNTVAGECSGCGKCCQAILPISSKEIQRIKSYIGKNKIKPFNRHTLWDKKFINICPFLNPENNRCLIYPVRPEVCNRFICSQYKNPNAKYFNTSDKEVINMYVEFLPSGVFPCPETDILKLNQTFNEQKKKVAHNYFRKKK